MDIVTCIKSFIDVVNHGGYTNASFHNYISPATLSRQINTLEQWLDAKLILRTTRQFELTTFGKTFYEQALVFLINLEQLQHLKQSGQSEPIGLLKIGIPLTFGLQHIVPILFQFMKTYSKVRLDITTHNHVDDLTAGRADIILSTGESERKDVISEKLCSVKRSIYATPNYLKNKGTPKKPEDLQNHNCFVSTQINLPNQWYYLTNKKIILHSAIRSNTFEVLKQAALNDMGLLFSFANAVTDLIDKKRLVEVLKKYANLDQAIHIQHLRYETSNSLISLVKYIKQHVKKVI